MKTGSYVAAFANLVRGAGTTTTVLGLAWTLGQAGKRVCVIDASPFRTAFRIAAAADSACRWPGVRLVAPETDCIHVRPDEDWVLIDIPNLCTPLGKDLLASAHGVVLVSSRDIASVRALPLAAGVLAAVRTWHPDLALLGLMLSHGRSGCREAEQILRDAGGGAIFSTVIPWEAELADWPVQQGADLPAARQAFAQLAAELQDRRQQIASCDQVPAGESIA